LNIIEKKQETFPDKLEDASEEVKQKFADFCHRYDTYSDDNTCHYQKIA
ncbi:13121_t:CDS:1, partial [Racocetra persica]